MKVGRLDTSTAIFLLLAAAPILGVVAVGIAWIRGATADLASLDRELERMEIASSQENNRNALAGALHAFEIAALADGPASATDMANRVQSGLQLRESQVERVTELIEPIGTAGNPDSVADAQSFRRLAIQEIAGHQVGAPVDEDLFTIEETVNRGLGSGSLASLFVQQDRLGASANHLRAMFEFQLDFDVDLRETLAEVAAGSTISAPTLRSTTLVRPLRWDAQSDRWSIGDLQLNDQTLVSIAQGAMAAGPVTDAFAALEGSETVSERNEALMQLLANDRRIGLAVDEAFAGVVEEYEGERTALIDHRNRGLWLLTVMLGFGLALVVASRYELRRRKQVERAHRNALEIMAEKAYRDPLTGLRNRRWVDERLGEIQPSVERPISFVYLDLDGFKSVNDVWGHDSGDDVLRTVGRSLLRWAQSEAGWELARFGGDEFVAVVSHEVTEESGEVDRLLQQIGRLETPVEGGVPLRVQVSAGIAVAKEPVRAADLILRADSALSNAKQVRRGAAEYYATSMSRTGELLPVLPAALAGDEFRAFLQPVFDLHHMKVAHVEALVRWFRPDGSMVSPVDFVPIVETYGLADRLTKAVLRDIGRMRREQPELPSIWINVSPIELHEDFATTFIERLRELDLDPALMGLEVTESAAIRNVEQVCEVLGELRGHGVRVAIDDLGAGYTPLGYLRRLPIDVVKVDRSLIDRVDQDPVNQQLVTGVFRLARQLGCDVVAEGVERPEELQWLRSLGVRYVQGFLLRRPGPPSELGLGVPDALSPIADASLV